MSGQQDHHTDRYNRARSDEEPGAHSGGEQQARDRSVPGTASAKEGYQPDRGTTAGKPLEGVEAPAEADAERGEGSEEVGDSQGP